MKVNQKVTILPSHSLESMGLEALEGKKGIIAELCFRGEGLIHGAWVALEEPYEGECEWYIPKISLFCE